MKRRMTSATLVAAMLLLGSFAIPASAQTVDTVIDGVSAPVCAEAIAAAYESLNKDVFDDNFAEFFDDDGEVTNRGQLLSAVVAFLRADGQTLADVCGIYLEVAPIVIERPEPPVTPPAPQRPTEVAGVTLARTGANTALLGLAGLALLGLGVVAVRRTRSDLGVR